MKRQFCLDCLLALRKAGRHNIRRVSGAKTLKVICWRCKCRRYGTEYEISRKTRADI